MFPKGVLRCEILNNVDDLNLTLVTLKCAITDVNTANFNLQ